MHPGVPGWGGQAICLGQAWAWPALQWEPVSVWGLVSADYHRGGPSAACVLFYSFFIITFIYFHVVGMCHIVHVGVK